MANETRPRALVLLVGEWPAVPAGEDMLSRPEMTIQRCATEVRLLKQTIAIQHPAWLMVGHGVDEITVRTLVYSGQAMYPDLKLAMLGLADDVRRCERWLRRGCIVYIERSTGVERAIALLTIALTHGIIVTDRIFHEAARARQVQPVGTLTRREEEVLQLMCLGLRNSDIAHSLHLTENTVEFHVSRLLAKLGARNRVEAVDRATALGLA
jgi:DNA-binding NarL/FixJ family response regulator